MKIVSCFLLITGFMACGNSDGGRSVYVVRLSPQSPSEGMSMRWSPKGKQLSLVEREGGMETEIKLGGDDVLPILLRLKKGEGQKYFNLLAGDWNRNGSLDDDNILSTTPNETRGKFWSSFDAVIDIPVLDPLSGESVFNPYPLSFWYVEDPLEPDQEKVIRFSRRGWMSGSLELDGVPAVILLTEMEMNGIYDTQDSWALAEAENSNDLYESANSRSLLNHGWLGENAYKIKSLHPSGRKVELEAYDPGITRADEDRARDTIAVDREAARSGKEVNFSHDYENSVKLAMDQGKLLFIDFETTWCGPCRTMDQFVYTADLTVEAFENILAVKVDGDVNRELVKKYDVKAYPTLIILSSKGKILAKKVGYLSVADIVAFVNEVITII
ncbi:MAG: thioredoxin family protein [Candidatus Aminicenantes bacterium]|nr:thioredoxin family protein [Candidatus Aminicenantes bacterium]